MGIQTQTWAPPTLPPRLIAQPQRPADLPSAGVDADALPPLPRWTKFCHRLGIYGCAKVTACPEQEHPLPQVKLSVECSVLQRGDEDAYLEMRSDQDWADIEHRRRLGHICHVAWYGRRIIAAVWSGAGRMHVDFLGCELVLSRGSHYVYDLFVRPAYRGQGIERLIEAVHRRQLQEAGYLRSVHIAEVFDHRTLGRTNGEETKFLGIVGYYGVGRLRRHFIKLAPTVSAAGSPVLLARRV